LSSRTDPPSISA
ncbi:unnamed protein product, partial [Rotaria sp. Silwood1]